MTKYRKALNKILINLVEKVQPLMEDYQKIHSGPMNDYTNEKAAEIDEKVHKYKQDALQEARKVYTEYLERLEKMAKSISGTDINKSDLALLETNLYTLNQEEFDVLQDKYEGNRAMEKILSGYAEKRGSQSDSNISESLTCRFMSDEQKKGLAKTLYNELKSWIENDNGFGVADYVLYMAGDMFVSADKLKE